MIDVLWVCSIPIPQIAESAGQLPTPTGGWMAAAADALCMQPDIHLTVCFPVKGQKEILHGQTNGIVFYSFFVPKKLGILPVAELTKESKRTCTDMQHIMDRVKPDILHVFGTEYPHALSAIRAYKRPERTIIHLQGIIKYCAEHYLAGIPLFYASLYMPVNVVKGSLWRQQRQMCKRSVFEAEAMRHSGYALGRTDLDRAFAVSTSSNIRYRYCGEVLRNAFYEGQWRLSACKKHTIFISQADYPIKGFHFFLYALKTLVMRFPDIHVYVAGKARFTDSSIKEKMYFSSYDVFLRRIVAKNGLFGHITCVGMLCEEDMKKHYMSAHVFVSASNIENSPNSVGEAMMLGTPIVASCVGGISSMLTHGHDAFLYQNDAPYMLAYYVEEIFKNDGLAEILSKNSRAHAAKLYDRTENTQSLLNSYYETIEGNTCM